MITVMENYDLVVSEGDTFLTAFQFNLNGYKLTGNETITFNIKANLEDKNPLISSICGIDTVNNVITANIPASTMKTLLAGEYFYDVFMVTPSGFKMSLIYSQRFIIGEVCHYV
jgi:hypothetical protein